MFLVTIYLIWYCYVAGYAQVLSVCMHTVVSMYAVFRFMCHDKLPRSSKRCYSQLDNMSGVVITHGNYLGGPRPNQ